MRLTAIAAALSLVLGSFVLSACNKGPDQNPNRSSAAGGTADQQQSQPANAPKRAQPKP
jgi:hypothetical protein